MLPAVWLLFWLLAATGEAAAESKAETVDFERDVQPILEKRCSPCHFPGGKMHDELPFDQAATIHKLNTRLFTRIRIEDERRVIRKFLAQSGQADK